MDGWISVFTYPVSFHFASFGLDTQHERQSSICFPMYRYTLLSPRLRSNCSSNLFIFFLHTEAKPCCSKAAGYILLLANSCPIRFITTFSLRGHHLRLTLRVPSSSVAWRRLTARVFTSSYLRKQKSIPQSFIPVPTQRTCPLATSPTTAGTRGWSRPGCRSPRPGWSA